MIYKHVHTVSYTNISKQRHKHIKNTQEITKPHRQRKQTFKITYRQRFKQKNKQAHKKSCKNK